MACFAASWSSASGSKIIAARGDPVAIFGCNGSLASLTLDIGVIGASRDTIYTMALRRASYDRADAL